MAYNILDGNIGRSVVVDHRYEVLTAPLEASLRDRPDGSYFYEVIRCVGGIPLFAEDHLERLADSVRGHADLTPAGRDALLADMRALIGGAGISDGNVKIVMTRGLSVVFASAFYYPEPEVYESGVRLGLLRGDRQQPNVKAVVAAYRRAVADKLASEGPLGPYFETLLYSGDGRILEGSRSNAFFIADGRAVTAPDEAVLKGVTRKYVLQAVRAAGLEPVMDYATIDGIGTVYREVFLSGTSIGVLPAASIEGTVLDSPGSPSIARIREAYAEIVGRYIAEHGGGR